MAYSPRVAWQKLMRILPLVTVLTAAGGAFASEGQVSPNLHIGAKAEKSAKNQKIGFTAFLKRSANNWGRGLVRLIAQKQQNRRYFAVKPSKTTPPARLYAAPKAPDCGILSFSAPERPASQAISQPANGAMLSFKDDICVFERQAYAVHNRPPPSTASQGPRYALNLPSWRSLFQWFRPVARGLGSISDSLGYRAALGVEHSTQGDIPLWQLAGTSRALSVNAISSPQMHFTIDPTKASASLTHGAMGSRSALSRHRSRDDWAQSVQARNH